ncbi:hypothetical protein ACOMHN_030015 [Nucella lapillus]
MQGTMNASITTSPENLDPTDFQVIITTPFQLPPDLDLPSRKVGQGEGYNNLSTLNTTGVDYYYNTNESGGPVYYGPGGEQEEEVFYPLLKQPGHMVLVYAMAYGLVTVMALVGNGLVMGVVVRKPSMHSVTNYFLFNLALADMLVALFCVPVNLIANLYNGQ